MKDAQRASPFLHVHCTRGQPVLVHHAFGVEVGEGRPFLHVRQHGRVMHSESAVRSSSAPMVGEHLQERILVYGVLTFAQSFGALLVGGSETIVRLATQPHESVTGPLDLEQTRCPLVLPYSTPRPRSMVDRRVDSVCTISDVRRNIRTGAIRSDVGNNDLVVLGSRGHRRTHRPRPNRHYLYPSRSTGTREVVIELQQAHLGVL